MTRRALFALAGATAFVPCLAQPAGGYPTRPIRLVVPVAPGGPADRPARILAEKLAGQLGQAIVVENRPGAAGLLGTTQVLQAPPDGYTLLLSLPSAQITAPLLRERAPFDGAKDFTPIGGFGRFTAVLLVNQSVPARTLSELVVHAGQRPGLLSYGSTGIGGMPHLVTELMKLRTGTLAVHVPYKGGAPAMQALLANEVQMLFGELSTALPFIRSGQLRALAVVANRHSALLPDVPTLAEAGVPGAPADVSWMGLAGPRGLPAAVVKRLSDALAQATQDPAMRQYFADAGGELTPSDPAAFQALWVADQRRWAALIKAKGLRAD